MNKPTKPANSEVIEKGQPLYIDQPVIVRDERGNQTDITPHMESIQQFVTEGYDIEAIAVLLAVDVDSFRKATEEDKTLKAVVRRGYILDRQEFKTKLRGEAHSMKSANIVKLYASHAHDIHDKHDQALNQPVIVINTGIQSPIPWAD